MAFFLPKCSCGLHEAALSGNTQMVKLLFEKGADPAAKDLFGKTPLDLAESRGTLHCVEILSKARPRDFELVKGQRVATSKVLKTISPSLNRSRGEREH